MVTHDKSIAPRFSRILRIVDGTLADPIEEDESVPEPEAPFGDDTDKKSKKKRRWLW